MALVLPLVALGFALVPRPTLPRLRFVPRTSVSLAEADGDGDGGEAERDGAEKEGEAEAEAGGEGRKSSESESMTITSLSVSDSTGMRARVLRTGRVIGTGRLWPEWGWLFVGTRW